MFWCWLSAKKEGGDCEEQSLPTIHQIRAMVVQHHHRKNKNSLWINIIIISSQKPTSAWGQVRLCSLEGILAFPDCPYPLSWGSITETPSIVLIIGRRKNGTKAENTSNISSSSLLKEIPLGEYQIKPLQSRSYNLYVVAEMILILLSALCPGFHLNFSSSSRLRLPSEQVTPLLRTLSQLSATVSGTSQDLTLLSQDLKMIKEGRMRDKYISKLRQI